MGLEDKMYERRLKHTSVNNNNHYFGLIAAGLIVLAWFWYFAPQAGKTGTLQILEQIDGVIVTSAGTYPTSFTIIRT